MNNVEQLEITVGARTFTIEVADDWSRNYVKRFCAEIETWADDLLLTEGRNRAEWIMAQPGTSKWEPPLRTTWNLPRLRSGRGVHLNPRGPQDPLLVTSDDLEYHPVFARTIVELHLLREEFARRQSVKERPGLEPIRTIAPIVDATATASHDQVSACPTSTLNAVKS